MRVRALLALSVLALAPYAAWAGTSSKDAGFPAAPALAFQVNIDARTMPDSTFRILGGCVLYVCLSTQQVQPLSLDPGAYRLERCVGAAAGTCGIRPTLDFSVASNGTVGYNPALEPAVMGAGTHTLIVNYFPNMVNIDARGLADSLFELDACACLSSRQVQSFVLSVGAHTIGLCGGGSGGCGIRPTISFTVQPAGTVSYDPSLEPAVMGMGTRSLVVNSFSFPPRGDDTEPSMGLFRIVVEPRFWPIMAGYSLGDAGFSIVNGVHRLVSPSLYDPATVIGRSTLIHEGVGADVTGTPVGTAGTPIADTSFTLIPAGFQGPTGTSELHTELRSLNMRDFGGLGVAVRAGINAPGHRISPGEIQARPDAVGLYPANSFFDVFVKVDLPLLGGNPGVTTLNNTTALVVKSTNLTCIPPRLVYLHEGPTGPVPLVFQNDDPQLPKRWSAGDHLGWLVLAGHGIDFDTVGTALVMQNRGRPSTQSSPFDEFIQLVNAEPEMADTATAIVDVRDVVTFAAPSAYVNPTYRDSLSNGLDAAAAKAAAGDPCGAIHDLVFGLLVHVDGLASPPDWVQDSTVRAVAHGTISALASQYQAQANTQGGCAPLAVGPQPMPWRAAIQFIHPNPTNGSATIGFGIPRRGRVTLAIFDLTGRRVRTLLDGELAAGVHQAIWDGRRDRGGVASSGIYFAHLITAGVVDVKRIVVVK